ncbi:MAG: non-ribosomal peptide synthetase, partial [bacterium]|nr:non-ribosomal peptide synthetase [bacterium]
MNKPNFSAELSVSAAQSIKESDYWLQKLANVPAKTGFPYDYPAGVHKKTGAVDTGTVSIELPAETVSRIMKISGGADVMLHMLLVAVVVALSDKYSHENTGDIIIGAPIYKQDIEADFINTVLPLRNRLFPGTSFKELLVQVKDTIVEAVDNQNYPIESILYLLGIPVEETGDFPLFDTAVLLENIHDKSYLQR